MTEMLKLTVNGTGKNMGDDDTGNMLKFWKLNQQSNNNNKCVIKRTLHRTTTGIHNRKGTWMSRSFH